MPQKHSASLVAGIFKKEVIKSPEERGELPGPTTTKFAIMWWPAQPLREPLQGPWRRELEEGRGSMGRDHLSGDAEQTPPFFPVHL